MYSLAALIMHTAAEGAAEKPRYVGRIGSVLKSVLGDADIAGLGGGFAALPSRHIAEEHTPKLSAGAADSHCRG
jgi:hypothetical protein